VQYVLLPSHFSPIHHPNNIWWGAQIMKLLSLLQSLTNHYYINTLNKVHNTYSKKTRHKLHKLANKTWHSCQFCQSAPLHTCLYVT
jgi:hypothetical protein